MNHYASNHENTTAQNIRVIVHGILWMVGAFLVALARGALAAGNSVEESADDYEDAFINHHSRH
jgi:hypothetical protein